MTIWEAGGRRRPPPAEHDDRVDAQRADEHDVEREIELEQREEDDPLAVHGLDAVAAVCRAKLAVDAPSELAHEHEAEDERDDEQREEDDRPIALADYVFAPRVGDGGEVVLLATDVRLLQKRGTRVWRSPGLLPLQGRGQEQ